MLDYRPLEIGKKHLNEMTSIGGNWVSQIDEASGCPYYTNTVTGETTWDYPTELTVGSAESASGGNWVETYDESSGAYYYLNDVTGVSTWDKPANYIPAAGAAAAPTAVTEVTSSPSDSNWTACQDEGGNTYYMNVTTGATQWEMPDEMKPAATPAATPAPAVVEPPAPVTAKRASFMPPPAVAATIKTAPVAAAAAPTDTGASKAMPTKRASFLPPPTIKPPGALHSSLNDRQSSLSGTPEEEASPSAGRASLTAAEEIAGRPSSVRDMKEKLSGMTLATPGSTAPLPPKPAPPPPAPPAAPPTAVGTTHEGIDVPPPPHTASSSGAADAASAPAGDGSAEGGGAEAPRPPKKMSKMQSFAALRAMESVNEDEECEFGGR